MYGNSHSKQILSKKFLLLFFVSICFVIIVAQYVTSHYGLLQWITIKVKSEKTILFVVFYDIGGGFEEKNKISQWITGSNDFQTIRLRLPLKHLKSIRIDPLTEPGVLYIKSIKLSSLFNRQHRWLADDIVKSFRPQNDISRFEVVDGYLFIESTGRDPFFEHVHRIPVINKINVVELLAFISFVFSGTFFFYSLLRRIYFKNVFKFLDKLKIQDKYIIGLVMIFVFILNYQKIHLYFLSDDFEFISRYQNLKNVFTGSASYHLNPTTYLFIFYLGNRLFGYNPLYYHTITLLLHMINILLVYKLAFVLFRSKWTSLAASLLFATYFMNYEVVNWVTGVFYILLTALYISTLLLFIKYLNEKKTIYYILFLSTFALAILTMEQGVTLLGTCIVLEILVSNNLERLRLSSLKQKGLFLLKSLTKYLLPLMIIISFFVLKQSMNQSFIVNTQTIGSFLKTMYGMVWHLFIPYPYGVNNGILYGTSKWNYRIFFFILLFGIISYTFVKHYKRHSDIRRDKRGIFDSDAVTYFFLFSCILIYVIPQSVATVIQARYFYLPSVFSSILLGSFLINNLSSLVKNNNHIRLLFHSWIIFFITVSMPMNIKFLRVQYHYWSTASEITKNVIRDTKSYLSERIQGQNLYYVNLPDGVYGQIDFGWPNAYLFRTGIYEAVPLAYPNLKMGVIKACRTDYESMITSHAHQLMTNDQLHQLAANEWNLVMVYDPKIKTIRKISNQ